MADFTEMMFKLLKCDRVQETANSQRFQRTQSCANIRKNCKS